MRKLSISPQQLPKLVSGTLICTSVAAIGLIISLTIWMSNTTNAVMAEKTHALIDRAVAAMFERTVITAWDYTHWDQAYEWVTTGDDEAVWNNLGSGASDSSTFEFIYIFDPDGTVSYAYETDRDGSDPTIVPAEFVTKLLTAIDGPQLSDNDALQAFAQIGDMSAVIAVTQIRPDDLTGIDIDGLPIFVGGLAINDEKLSEMAATFGLSDITITAGPTTDNTIVLRDLVGQEIGQLQWTPPKPGNTLLAKSVPIIIVASALLLSVAVLIARLSAGQTNAFLHEYTSARTDRLTGLMNRSGLDDLVKSKHINDALENGRAAVLYIDLTGFKSLNDTIGHTAGDQALVITAKRLRAAVRETDTAARLGGDEFLCLLIDDKPLQIAQFVADRIMKTAAQPVQIGADQCTIPAAIGIAITEAELSWQKLMHRADTAMYHCKRNGTVRPVVFHEVMGRTKDSGGQADVA